MLHVFWPAVEAASNHALVGKLKTADLPDEIRAAQFAKLKSLTPIGKAVHFGGSGQLAKSVGESGTFLCLTTEHLTESERHELDDWASSQGLGLSPPDPAEFLFVAWNYPSFLRLRDNFSDPKKINNELDVLENGYVGHDIYDVMGWYDRFEIVSLPANWTGVDKSPIWTAARISSSLRGYRSDGMSDAVAHRLLLMLDIEEVAEENLYFALTSVHPKQTFFEVYKFLETIFYLPWMQALRDSLGLDSTALHLARECHRELGWRGREAESVMRLFDMAPPTTVQSYALKSVKCFADLNPGVAGSNSYGRRIYKIRNFLVHQEDYEDDTPLELADEDWPIITAYLLDVVRYLYLSWSKDIPKPPSTLAA